jgi:putative ABC transport system permease protein
MTFWKLIHRNLSFHARAHLGVVLGAAIGSAALIGALVVGDSVRESLTNMALQRLGKIHFALSTQDRLFQTGLEPRLRAIQPPDPIRVSATPPAYVRPFPASSDSCALVLPGIVARQDGVARANKVNVLGVETDEWPRLADWGKLSPGVWLPGYEGEMLNRDGVMMMKLERGKGPLTSWKTGGTAFINQTLARQLAAREGDEIIVRVRKPSALGLDAAISPRNEDTIALRLRIGALLPADMLGDVGLTAQPTPPANLFLPLEFLSDKLGIHNQANLLVHWPIRA